MNIALSKFKNLFPFLLCFICMNLMIINGSSAQKSDSGANDPAPAPNNPVNPNSNPTDNDPIDGEPTKPTPKPMVINPPTTPQLLYCEEVISTSSLLPIYIANLNDITVDINNLTLDIDPSITYTSTSGVIQPNTTKLFYISFSGGNDIEDIFGMNNFTVGISYDVTYNFVLFDPFTESVPDGGYYCVIPPPPPPTIGIGTGGGRTKDGPQENLSTNRLVNSEIGNVDAKPNPTTGNLNISLDIPEDDMNLSLTMYNTLGQEVKSLATSITCGKGNYTDNYSIEELEKGMYYILVQLNGQTKTIPIVKL